MRRVFIVALLLVFTSVSTTAALTPEQKRVFRAGVDYFNTNTTSLGCGVGVSAGTAPSNKLFFIGDSITVGTYYDGKMLEKAAAAGFAVNTVAEEVWESEENLRRAYGPSIEAYGAENVTSIQPYLSEHAQDFSIGNAGIIVVALGTNDTGNNREADMAALIDFLRDKNETAQIIWVNTYFFNYGPGYEVVNDAIGRVASEKNIDVIDYATAAASKPDMAPPSSGDDTIHIYGQEAANKADFIISQIPGSKTVTSGATNACGAPTGTGDNIADAISYLKNEKGYTLEQAIGMVANMKHESGVRPKRFQGIFKEGDCGVDMSLQDEVGEVSHANFQAAATQAIEQCFGGNINNIGWGIVQWTPASKMHNPSVESGASSAQIDSLFFQLDFLVGSLTGEGLGSVLAETAAGNDLRQQGDVRAAAQSFAVRFERCADCTVGSATVDGRMDTAVDLLTKYGSL